MTTHGGRVLVTGVAGFLGPHVAHEFLRAGWSVVGFDKAMTRIEGVHGVLGDLLDVESIISAAAHCDAICHIGAIGDVYLAAHDPALAAAVNVTGSTNVGLAAARAGAKVVYASTWEVYGRPRYEPVDEDHPCEPDHPYNITKLAGERMLLAADHLHDVPVTALRLGTAYGSGLRPNSVFRIFIDRARNGEPINIQGDGSQGRQFTHASDIARAFVAAASSDVHGIALNAVAARTVSIKELAELVTASYPTEVIFSAARPGDVPPSYVSSERIAALLGWEAQTDFAEGLQQLINSG
jgi:UDP-glucose 4-epimerase